MRERTVLLVSHEDGDWIFTCGGADHTDDDWKVVGVGHLLSEDPTLNDCADLEIDYEAERSGIGQPWIRTAINESNC